MQIILSMIFVLSLTAVAQAETRTVNPDGSVTIDYGYKQTHNGQQYSHVTYRAPPGTLERTMLDYAAAREAARKANDLPYPADSYRGCQDCVNLPR